MAHAGAALVQVYTLFGYTGVGVARLLKDDISRSMLLAGSGRKWVDEVGADWAKKGDTSMGWKSDQERLKNEAEVMKREVEELGEMLRRLNEEAEVKALALQAKDALASGGDTQTTPEDKVEPAPGPKSESTSEQVPDDRRQLQNEMARMIDDLRNSLADSSGTRLLEVGGNGDASIAEDNAPETTATLDSTGTAPTMEDVQLASETVEKYALSAGSAFVPAASGQEEMQTLVVVSADDGNKDGEEEWVRNVRGGSRRLV
jgi:hypothetical protein